MTKFIPQRLFLLCSLSFCLQNNRLPKLDFVICIEIMIVQECWNANNIDKCLCYNSLFAKTTRLITSEKIAAEFLVLLEWYWVKKLSFLFLLWHLEGPKIPEVFVIRAQFDFGSRVYPNQLAWFFLTKSQSKVFYFCLKFAFKINRFSPCNGLFIDQICLKVLLILTCQGCPTHISSAPNALFFHQVVNRYPFTWGCLFVSK